jgi:hypothetical protein
MRNCDTHARETARVGFDAILYCPTSTRPSPLHLAAFLGHRLPSQTHTSLFCALCPHSCAPGKDFLVGHLSWNCSRPSTLNLRVLWRWASGKEVATCCYGYPIILVKPWAGMLHSSSFVTQSLARLYKLEGVWQGSSRGASPEELEVFWRSLGNGSGSSVFQWKTTPTKYLVELLWRSGAEKKPDQIGP